MARLTKEERTEIRQEVEEDVVYPGADDIIRLLADLDAADKEIARLRGLVGRAVDDNVALKKENERLRKALPDPDKLRKLAKFVDALFPDDPDPEVQRDLCRWADAIEQAPAVKYIFSPRRSEP